MADLLTRLEITKLARELGCAEEDLELLADRDPLEVRDLTHAVTTARFERLEERVTRLAGLSRLLPVPLTAKIAQLALGARMSGWVASVMDPRDAARLAGHLPADFLADVAVSLDPTRVGPLLAELPDDLLVGSGTRLLSQGEHVTLARLVAAVDVEVALRVVASGTPADLLQVALFTEDHAALDAIVQRLPDETLAGVVRAAADADAYDAAVTILASLSPQSCGRLVGQVHVVDVAQRDALVAAVAEHDMWAHVLPSLHLVDAAELRTLVNVGPTLDPAVVDRVVATGRELGLAPQLVHLVLALDDEHLAVLREVEALGDPGLQQWLIDEGGVSEQLVVSVLSGLGLR